MSDLSVPAEVAKAHRLRDLVFATIIVAGALFTLYAVFINQGVLPHEFAHDGRHLFAVPCH